MKLFFTIFGAIIASALVIWFVIALAQAKHDNDDFKEKMAAVQAYTDKQKQDDSATNTP